MVNQKYATHGYWLLAGIFAGAAAALLMAPKNGRRTRRLLRERVEDAAESVSDARKELRDRGRRIAKGAEVFVNRASHAISR